MKLILLLVLVFAGAIGLGFYLSPDDLSGCESGPTAEIRCRSADAVVAVSGGDTHARTEEAIRLYHHGWAPMLIFSGAAQDESGPSNAAAMRRTALEAGVPEEDVLIEEKGRTTGHNAEKTEELASENGISSVIVVTSAYHQRRASLEFERYFGKAAVRSHPAPKDAQWSKWWWWVSPRGWYLTGGELAKIAVFYAEGVVR